MSSFTYVPSGDEVPTGMVHVGWMCTALRPGHVLPDMCFMPLDRVDGSSEDGEVHLFDANHHASWVPVYAKRAELFDG